jgi:hypothetical protein
MASPRTATLDDHDYVQANRQTPIASYYLHQAKFEPELLKTNADMRAVFDRDRVINCVKSLLINDTDYNSRCDRRMSLLPNSNDCLAL